MQLCDVAEVKEIAESPARDVDKIPAFENAQREVSTPRDLHTTRSDLEGQTYPGTDVEYRRRVLIVDGECVEGVFPQFDSKFETVLPESLRLASDDIQFRYCTQQLSNRLISEPEFADRFTPRQLEQIKNGEPRISGLTWHHAEVPGKMQLVNAAEHAVCRHTGGRSVWGGGQECR